MRLLLSVALMLVLTGAFFSATSQAASPAVPASPLNPSAPRNGQNRPRGQEARVVIEGMTNELLPADSNIWQCACDTDGCWPGCFTIASASILEYWSKRGYPQLWNGEANDTLQRLRGLFPNLFCYDNQDGDGKPGEAGYDAYDVAKGFDIFVRERGYSFEITPIPGPTFAQVMAEIDAGRPVIGAFSRSPWGSHAGTIIGYDTSGGKRIMIVRPNLASKSDTELEWGQGYGGFGIVTIEPVGESTGTALNQRREIEVVVDDTDPGFVMKGEWQIATGIGTNGSSRQVLTTDPSNLGPQSDTATAQWTPRLPFDGLYEVFASMPRADAGDGNTHLATYNVAHAEGVSYVRRTQHDVPAGWMSLGLFPFMRGERSTVRVGNQTGDAPPRMLWADGMRFVYRGPLLVQREDGGPVAIVENGLLHELRDSETLGVLRMQRLWVRKIGALEYGNYPLGDPLPSSYSVWVGQYFDNETLAQPATAVRADNALNFAWGGAAPVAGLGSNVFSARWSRMMALTEGEYPFRIDAVGGMRLWIDGRLEIDAWESPAGQLIAHEKTVTLLSGLHKIEIEYVNRGGNSQLRFGNLPPNAPVVQDTLDGNAITAPELTMRWLDAGDPDSVVAGTPRRFFATLWREDGFRLTSGWITLTNWSVPLQEDGRYSWSVLASDGRANSATSATRSAVLDRTAPWTQMLDAQPPIGRVDAAQAGNNGGLRLQTDAAGNQVVIDTGATVTPEPLSNQLTVLNRALYKQFGNAPVVKLSWWATDTLSMNGMHYVLQSRELVQARTEYTLTRSLREVTKLGYELVLSGTQEITQPVVLTETVAFTDVAPILVMTQISNAAWITVSTGIPVTETVFAGYPGSTYEFRVRGIDGLGNEQAWYDGYALQVKIDEEMALPAGMKPGMLFTLDRNLLPAESAPAGVTATLPITASAALSGTFGVTIATGISGSLVYTVELPPIDGSSGLTATAPLTRQVPMTAVATPPDGLGIMPTIPVEGGLPLQPMPTIAVGATPPTPTPEGGLAVMPTIEWTPQAPPAAPEPPAGTPTPIPLPTRAPTQTPAPSATATSTPTPISAATDSVAATVETVAEQPDVTATPVEGP